MNTWINFVVLGFRKIIDLNWKLANAVWQCQNKIIGFLVGGLDSVVLSCGLAGIIYTKKKEERVNKNAAQEIKEVFQNVSQSCIDAIIERRDVYIAHPAENSISVINLATGDVLSLVVSDELRPNFINYMKCEQDLQAAVAELVELKADKQKNKDKKLLATKNNQIKLCQELLAQARKEKLTRIVEELLGKQGLTLVGKRFQEYLLSARSLLNLINQLKEPQNLYHIFQTPAQEDELKKLAHEIRAFAEKELAYLQEDRIPHMVSEDVETIIQQNNLLLDSAWALEKEILDIVAYLRTLIGSAPATYKIFKEWLSIAATFRGLNKKLEARGRDSCGLSIMLAISASGYKQFMERLTLKKLTIVYQERQVTSDLGNYAIDVFHHESRDQYHFTFTYKTAKAIGQLGDNVHQLQTYICKDTILRELMSMDQHELTTTIVHTRWASQGIVSLENCHPVDNKGLYKDKSNTYRETTCVTHLGRQVGHIYAVLNGDIDNYLKLREQYETTASRKISEKITTDAKIIPLVIEHFVAQGHPLEKAFLKAVNEFRGSFAIEMHSDLEPDKIYLAQQGKGQGLYVGISSYGYHIASEIYGFVEQTPKYIAMEPGQVFVLEGSSGGGIDGIRCFDFYGQPITLDGSYLLAHTPITTRDIFLDSAKFTHFLEKEIHESPEIIAKTLRGKWEKDPVTRLLKVRLGEEILPAQIKEKMIRRQYRKILFLGMGTAHAAAESVAAAFAGILEDVCSVQLETILATEFTATYVKKNRNDTLVIAISQSGGTTDTNAALRKLAEDQADILGIINKRDSDMSFLVDGLLYTGDGRDVEIAVASTKAFYAQVAAGMLYSIAFAQILGVKPETLHNILEEILQLPAKIRELFARKDAIIASASALAPRYIYWDTLSTGLGMPVARELKIKLSELCYMSIAEFHAANKKHVNLSAEALILCFFGAVQKSGSQGSLAKDLQGEISIFLAQKNVPIVFTTVDDNTFDDLIPEGRRREQLLKVIPPVTSHLSVILNTAAGHLWSYYAAKALNQRSDFIAQILDDINSKEDALRKQGVEPFRLLKNKELSHIIKTHYKKFSTMMQEGMFTNGLPSQDAIKLEKLFLASMQMIPAPLIHIVFGENWGGERILQEFKGMLYYARTWLSRSIDAIKHQAKYITVGVTGFEGIAGMTPGLIKDVFVDLLKDKHITPYQEDVSEYDMITLTNVQRGLRQVNGGMIYQVSNNNGDIYLEVIKNARFGSSQNQTSRYEKPARLIGGRKAMAIKNDKVHIGRGHDQNKIIVIPIRSLGNISKVMVIGFEANESLSGRERVELLGGLRIPNTKAEEILTAVQEYSDKVMNAYNLPENISEEEFLARLLETIPVEDLLLLSHEEITERIILETNGFRRTSQIPLPKNNK